MLLRGVDMTTGATLRIVVVAPDTLNAAADDSIAESEAQRSRWLRVGLLESGYKRNGKWQLAAWQSTPIPA